MCWEGGVCSGGVGDGGGGVVVFDGDVVDVGVVVWVLGFVVYECWCEDDWGVVVVYWGLEGWWEGEIVVVVDVF